MTFAIKFQEIVQQTWAIREIDFESYIEIVKENNLTLSCEGGVPAIVIWSIDF